MANKDMSCYRGKRALIFTGVSTAQQVEKYSHAAQERQVREKLISPLGLRIVDERRHIIHDTYSGLEYRYRKALEDILEMAERGEFDVLCMDVLDRGLGRRALTRESFRMQLKESSPVFKKRGKSHHRMAPSVHFFLLTLEKQCSNIDMYNVFWQRTRGTTHDSSAQDQAASHA